MTAVAQRNCLVSRASLPPPSCDSCCSRALPGRTFPFRQTAEFILVRRNFAAVQVGILDKPQSDPKPGAEIFSDTRRRCTQVDQVLITALRALFHFLPPFPPLRYEVNFEPQSGILNDLYQGYVRTPPGQWSTVSLPLNRLLLTGQGQIRDIQRKWDTGVALMSLGFTIADGVGGPFRLDVAWVAMVPEVREGFRSGGGGGG